MAKKVVYAYLTALYMLPSMSTPGQLSPDAISELKRLYQEEFGACLSEEEAQEVGTRLLRIFSILMTLVPPPVTSEPLMGHEP